MKNKWVKLAITTKALKMINDRYGKYRLLHPLTWVYTPYILINLYHMQLLLPSYKLTDVYCIW